jgi:hypothetical protein
LEERFRALEEETTRLIKTSLNRLIANQEDMESISMRAKSNARDLETIVKTVNRACRYLVLVERHINGDETGRIPPFKKEGD